MASLMDVKKTKTEFALKRLMTMSLHATHVQDRIRPLDYVFIRMMKKTNAQLLITSGSFTPAAKKVSDLAVAEGADHLDVAILRH